jgi:uncharacterized protein YgiM (DUF1202 family)
MQRFLMNLRQLSARWQLRMLFALCLIWLGPTIACGSFAPRPTPTPTTPAEVDTGGEVLTEGTAQEAATPTPAAVATDTPTMIPTPTVAVTATLQPGTALAPGQPARVVAPAGLNMRDAASASGNLLLQLGAGVRVTVLEGPQQADGFTWWRVDDGQGNVGWVAERDAETEWLSPQLGGVQPSDRAPQVGDRVQVTTGQLTIRQVPGTNAQIVTRATEGQQFTIQAGPQSANGFTWYQIRSDDGSVEGWAADGDSTTRWLSPLE